jgi:hypothetical protein
MEERMRHEEELKKKQDAISSKISNPFRKSKLPVKMPSGGKISAGKKDKSTEKDKSMHLGKDQKEDVAASGSRKQESTWDPIADLDFDLFEDGNINVERSIFDKEKILLLMREQDSKVITKNKMMKMMQTWDLIYLVAVI